MNNTMIYKKGDRWRIKGVPYLRFPTEQDASHYLLVHSEDYNKPELEETEWKLAEEISLQTESSPTENFSSSPYNPT